MHLWVEEAGVLFLLLFDPKDSHTIRPLIGFAKDIGTPANEPMVQCCFSYHRPAKAALWPACRLKPPISSPAKCCCYRCVCVCWKVQRVWHTSCLCSEKNLVCWFAIIAHHHYDTIGILNGTPLVCAYDLLGWEPLGEHHNTWKPRGV